jgi:hypothetical protein
MIKELFGIKKKSNIERRDNIERKYGDDEIADIINRQKIINKALEDKKIEEYEKNSILMWNELFESYIIPVLEKSIKENIKIENIYINSDGLEIEDEKIENDEVIKLTKQIYDEYASKSMFEKTIYAKYFDFYVTSGLYNKYIHLKIKMK